MRKLEQRKSQLLAMAVVASAVLGAQMSASAADTTASSWSGATNTTWATATNWDATNGVPSATVSGKFDGTFTNQPTPGAATTAQGLWLTSGVGQNVTIATGTNTLTLTGNATLGGQDNAGIMLDDTTNNRGLTITGKLANTNSTGFYVNEGGTLSITATLALAANTTLTLGGNNAAGTTAITGTGVISGASSSMYINTLGTVTLQATNTYGATGSAYNTTLAAGTLNINNTKALGAGTFVINGGTIDTTNATGGLTGNNNVITWGGDFTFKGTSNFSLGTGAVTLTGNRQVTVTANTLTIGGAISGSGYGITKNGAGTLVLSVANTFTGGLTINNGIVSGNSSTAFGTGPISLGDTTSGNSNNATLLVTINNSTIANNITVNAGSSGLLTIQGNVSNATTFSGTVALNNNLNVVALTSGKTTAITGNITGSSNITVGSTNVGVVTLSGTNTGYTGLTTVNGGTLRLGSASALGTIANGTIINSGATLDLNSQTITNLEPLTIYGTGVGGNGVIMSGSFNTSTFSGPITLGSSVNLAGNATGGNVKLSGSISDGDSTFSITKVGSGTLTLAGANNFKGGINLTAGTLAINNAAALGSGTLAINGTGVALFNSSGGTITVNPTPITWTSDVSFTQNGGGNTLDLGTGAVTLSGGATRTFSGSAGSLIISGPIGEASAGLGITINTTGATLALAGANTYTGNTTLTAGTLDIRNAAAFGGGTLVINGGALWRSGTATFTKLNPTPITWAGDFSFTSNSGGSALNLGTGAVTLTGTPGGVRTYNGTGSAGTLTIEGAIGDGGAGIGVTVNANSTILSLAGANTYTGNTTLNNGILGLSNAAVISSNGRLVINGGGIKNLSGAALTLTTNFQQTWGGNFSFETQYSPNGNDLNMGTGAVTLTNSVTLTAGSGILTVGGAIGEGGSGYGLTKTGGGTLILTNTGGTYTGSTTVLQGTLSVASLSNAGSSSTLGAPAAANSTIGMGSGTNSAALAYTGTGSTTDRVIDLASTTGGVTITQSGTGLLKFTSSMTATGAGSKMLTLQGSTTGSGEMAGAIVDNSTTNKTSVTKAGTGTWVLSGTNTYTGTTTISGGLLQFGSAASLPSSTIVTINSNAALAVGNTPVQNILPQVNVASTGTVAMTSTNATETINFSSNSLNTYLGAVGTVNFTGNFTPNGTAYLLGGGGGTLVYNPQITGSNSVSINGPTGGGISGTVTLTAANTYSGGTNVLQGTLNVSNASALGTGFVSLLNSATVVVTPELATPLKIGRLGLAANSKFDLTTNDLVIQSDTTNFAADVTAITALIKKAHDNGGGAVWGGSTGITTSSAAILGGLEFKGLAIASDATAKTIKIKYTYVGDADLDGKITMDDYLLIDSGYLFNMTGYGNGDFDYSGGAITAADYALIDNSFLNQGAALGDISAAQEMINLHASWFGAEYTNALENLAAVPEPASLALLGLGAMSLLRRRR